MSETTAMTPATTQGTTEKKRIILPDNTAGRLIYDVFLSLAKKMWALGKEVTGDFALTNFPDCKLVKNEYANRTFRRILKTPSGDYIAVVYDYMEKTTAVVELPSWEST